MTENPQFDPVRSAAIRDEIRAMVSPKAAKRPARRAILFTSIATAAVLAVGGVGVAIAQNSASQNPGKGVVVAPTPDSTPRVSSDPVPSGTSGTGIVDPAGTPSPTPIAPDPTPTPTVDLADPSSWLITYTGVGPLRLGQERDEAMKDMTAFTLLSDDGTCPARFYESDALDMEFSTTGSGTTLSVIGVGNGLPSTPARIAASPKTAEGIRQGSTEAEVRAAYPGVVRAGGDSSYGYLTQTDGQGHWLVFFVTNGVVQSVSVQDSSEPRTEYCG